MTGEEFLEQALSQKPEAKKLYDNLPPSHRREYVKLIDEAKLSATKERRAAEAVQHILDGPKRLAQAGYSQTPLAKKLGIGQGINFVVHAPAGYEDSLQLDQSIKLLKRVTPSADFAQAFFTSRRRLENDFETLKRSLRNSGSLWICWPKGSSRIETDLDANLVREIGLAHGLVDTKVAAIDDDWSGLKFVYRLKDR